MFANDKVQLWRSRRLTMELSWLNKLRITVSMTVGVLIIGFLAWPLAAPLDPLGPIRISNFTIGGVILLLGLALTVGFVAYFLSWPYGREIGILAVPSGLAVWAINSGSMAKLMLTAQDITQRQELYRTLTFEPFFWLLVIALGHIGVLLAHTLRPAHDTIALQIKTKFGPGRFINAAIALIVSSVIASLCVRIFAREATTFTKALVAQPATGQIVFAILAAYAVAGFVTKKFLDADHIWTTISASIVIAFSIATYGRQITIEQIAYNPATFFPNAVVSILPVQMITFGTLGSVAGYWLAVRFEYWRKHESK
jgi:hypothetical protein